MVLEFRFLFLWDNGALNMNSTFLGGTNRVIPLKSSKFGRIWRHILPSWHQMFLGLVILTLHTCNMNKKQLYACLNKNDCSEPFKKIGFFRHSWQKRKYVIHCSYRYIDRKKKNQSVSCWQLVSEFYLELLKNIFQIKNITHLW